MVIYVNVIKTIYDEIKTHLNYVFNLLLIQKFFQIN